MLVGVLVVSFGKRALAVDADAGEPPARVEPPPAPTAAAFGAVPLNGEPEGNAPEPNNRAVVAAPHAVPGRVSNVSSNEDWQAPEESENGDCTLHGKLHIDLSRCNTPRDGTPSGAYLTFDLGAMSPKGAAADRVGIGTGPAAQVRLGFEFWDQLVVGIGGAFLDFTDRRPTTQSVIVCTKINGADAGCDQEPSLAKSDVRAGAGSLEVGYQKRFRPSHTKSVSVGVMAGYLETFGNLTRSITFCDDCTKTTLNADASGAYASPFIRVTFGHMGEVALVLRSQWFVTGDLLQFTTLGVEIGAP